MTLWEANEAVRDAAAKLGEAERGLGAAAEEAIAVLDAAMKLREVGRAAQWLEHTAVVEQVGEVHVGFGAVLEPDAHCVPI